MLCYLAQQGYLDYGYGCDYSYVQQHYPDAYGGDNGHLQFISLSNPYESYNASQSLYIQQNFLDGGGYGGEAPHPRQSVLHKVGIKFN
ncbi:hypothetical protein Hanom_Chr10g00942821 [Helianthus anomalus]